MLSKLHEKLGLSDGAPKWLKELEIIGVLILITAAITLVRLDAPVHVGYHTSTIAANLSGSGGITKGDLLQLSLNNKDEPISLYATDMMWGRAIGDTICVQELTDQRRGGTRYAFALASKCGT